MLRPFYYFITISVCMFLVIGCGGDDDKNKETSDGGTTTTDTNQENPHEARCQALCDNAGFEDACDDSDKNSCLTDCRARTSGLKQNCAICILDNSEALSRGICSGTGPSGEPGSCSCFEANFAPISIPECTSFCQ